MSLVKRMESIEGAPRSKRGIVSRSLQLEYATVDCPMFSAGRRVSLVQLSLSSDSHRRGRDEMGDAQHFTLLHATSGLTTTAPGRESSDAKLALGACSAEFQV